MTADPTLGAEARQVADEVVELGAWLQERCFESNTGMLDAETAFKSIQHVQYELRDLANRLETTRSLARQHWADETRPRQVAS